MRLEDAFHTCFHFWCPSTKWLPWEYRCAAFVDGYTNLMEKYIVIMVHGPFVVRNSGALVAVNK